jgi:hypothetical protein
MKKTKEKSAEDLARTWWKQNITFYGDHTNGMYINVRNFVDIVKWCNDIHDVDYTGSAIEEEAVRILTPIAQRYIDENKNRVKDEKTSIF